MPPRKNVWRFAILCSCLNLVVGLTLAGSATANVAVKPPFATSMVLQREMPIPIWGTAASGEEVTITLASQSKTVTTPSTGKWTAKLDPMPAGGPYMMTFKGTNTVTLNDVYVGEVWQAAGQSNVDTRLNFYSNLSSEITQANLPLLRYYTLRQPGQTTTWEVVSPSTAGPLSALAYFFGKELQQKTGLAVGLVVTAVGGTRVSAWLDPATLKAHTDVTDSDRGSMWNMWVAPVVGYALRGTMWFQGENNANTADGPTYGERFKWLIGGWRAAWGQGDFPFYFGQLSNTHAMQTDPNNASPVATIREGQRMGLALPNTAMSVNMDIGVADDWHFPKKSDAGHRLALPARANLYGETDLVYSGPLYTSKSISGNKVTLNFAYVGGGLMARDGGALKGFAIAGAAGAWVWGDAVITGDTVVVSSATVATPTRVRYAWGDNPVLSLYNKEGLPASSFTTESADLIVSGRGAGGTGAGGAGGTNGASGGAGGNADGGATGGAGPAVDGGTLGSGGASATGGSSTGGTGTTAPGGALGSGNNSASGGSSGTGGNGATGGSGTSPTPNEGDAATGCALSSIALSSDSTPTLAFSLFALLGLALRRLPRIRSQRRDRR